jgi:DNA helicase-2/ATP-dependent DNA helicase PcrA
MDIAENIPRYQSDEPRYVPELSEGDGVQHQIFGSGTVIELHGDLATIYFKNKGTKKLDIGFAPLKKIDS